MPFLSFLKSIARGDAARGWRREPQYAFVVFALSGQSPGPNVAEMSGER